MSGGSKAFEERIIWIPTVRSDPENSRFPFEPLFALRMYFGKTR